jgi:prevent-host-death family protein
MAEPRQVQPWLTNVLVNRMLREMVSFNIYEAKTQLSKLIRLVRAGQEVVIADAGTPVAKLVPIEEPKAVRALGGDRGKIWVAPDAFDPLTGEDLAVWDGTLFPEAPKRQPRPATEGPRRRRGARLRARR